MHPRKLPTRFALDQVLETTPEGLACRVLDQDAARVPCRLVVAQDDPAASLLLRQNHMALVRLSHPHMSTAMAVGQLEDGTWYAQREWLNAPASTPEALLEALKGWLAGLAHLHQAGLVHGDLRADRLGLALDGTPKLADTGRRLRIGHTGDAHGLSVATAAPELLLQGRVDGRTDLYMLGVICREALGDAELSAPWPELLARLTAPVVMERFTSAAEALAFLGTGVAPHPARLATPFVGRRAEMAALTASADAATEENRLHATALFGEAGVGKTRLLEQFRQRLTDRGYVVASARPAGGLLSAWTPLLPALLGRVSRATAESLAPMLAAVLPGLAPQPAPALEPRAEQLRLFRAIATLIEEAAGETGLALCLDDWHTADPASRELYTYLQRALPAAPVCVVLAGDTPPDDDTPALELGRFRDGEVRALCRGLWDGKDPGGGVLAQIEEATGGHPALVEEVVEACAMAVAGGQRPSAALRAQLQPQPVPVRSLAARWSQKLSAVSAGARTLACAAAVTGARAGMPLLQAASGLEDVAFLMAVEELQAVGALSAEAEGYTLAAPARAATAEVAPETLARQHAEALGYWRVAAQMGVSVPASRLAHHAIAAGEQAAGAFYALAAAREALRLFALTDAEAFLTAGASALAALTDAPADWKLDYATALGDLARYQGRGVDAETRYREAIELAPSEQAAELHVSLGIALNLQSRSLEAELAYREGLQHAAASAVVRGRALTALARLRVRLGDGEGAIARCREALALSDLPSLYRGEALGLLGLALTTSEPPRPQEGLSCLEEARQLAEASGDRLALNNACMLEGNARMAVGQLPAARGAFERYSLLTAELGLRDEMLCANLNLAQVAYEEGHYTEAFQRARAGTEAARESGNRIYEAFGATYVGLAGCHLGFLAEAEQGLASAIAIASDLKSDHMVLQVLLAQLEATLFLGRLGRAEELGLEVLRRQETAGIHDFAGAHALLMGQLYELAGEVNAAISHLQRARALGEAVGSLTLLAGAQLGLGQVALHAGQLGVAQTRGLEALALGERAGALPLQLRAHLLLARVNKALDYPESARAHLDAAAELSGDLGAPHWQAMVWHQIGRLSEEGGPLRQKAATFLQFYLQQLPPRARQEFMNWPDRREVFIGRPTTPLNPDVLRGGQ